MAKDVLGRELYPGDLVIKSALGRGASNILLGVVASSGKSLICRNCYLYDNSHRTSDIKRVTNLKEVFKLSNPTKEELKAKEIILEYMKQSNQM